MASFLANRTAEVRGLLGRPGSPGLRRWAHPGRADVVAWLSQIGLALAFVGLWELGSGRWLSERLISSPSAVYAQLVVWYEQGLAYDAAVATLSAVAWGLVWGVAAGMLGGLAVGLIPALNRILSPIVTVLFAMPKTALLPLFILWFGLTPRERTVFTAVVVFFFMFYAVHNGVRDVPPNLTNAVRMMGAGRIKLVTALYLPASLGWLFAGLRVAVPYAFVATTTAEIVASPEGIGHLITTAGNVLNTAGVFAGIVLVSTFAVIAGTVVNILDNRTAQWRL